MKKTYLRACAGAVALSLLACGSTPAESLGQVGQSITSGTADDVDTSAVFIIAKKGSATGYCSGVVVSPHVVLTAAHCAAEDYQYAIFLGADHNDPAATALAENFVAVAEHHPHPEWDTALGDVNDVGVLITSTPIPRAAVPLDRRPMVASDVGREIRIVGYGQIRGDDKRIGRRTMGVTTIAAFDEGSLELAGSPNICLFDSGGPTFLRQDGVDVVAGIHAVVESTACDGKGYDMRVEHYADFIDRYIAAADPPVDAGPPAGDAGVVEDAAPPDAGSSSTSAPTAGCALGGSRARSPFGALLSTGGVVLLFAAALARRQRGR